MCGIVAEGGGVRKAVQSKCFPTRELNAAMQDSSFNFFATDHSIYCYSHRTWLMHVGGC